MAGVRLRDGVLVSSHREHPLSAPRYSWRWWGLSIVHNCFVHPWQPLADLLDLVPACRRVSRVLYWLHDHTAPVGAG